MCFPVTIGAGTLVPFMVEVALPGDTFDINLGCEIMTHPTIGPLFGSMKVQLDVFQAPVRLYQAQLHNNKLGIGMNMANIKLPQITLEATEAPTTPYDQDNYQINPSCILSYLGIRGVGKTTDPDIERNFNAIPYLAYWEIYKNYYANKQEEEGAVVHNTLTISANETITTIEINGNGLPQAPTNSPLTLNSASTIVITWVGAVPAWDTILLQTNNGS